MINKSIESILLLLLFEIFSTLVLKLNLTPALTQSFYKHCDNEPIPPLICYQLPKSDIIKCNNKSEVPESSKDFILPIIESIPNVDFNISDSKN